MDYKATNVENHLQCIDFTINSMLWDIKRKNLIIKPEHLSDLKARTLRSELYKEEFLADPVRIYRAFRLKKRLGLTLDNALKDYLKAENVSLEMVDYVYRNHRLTREMKKCVKDLGVSGFVEMLEEPIIKEINQQLKVFHKRILNIFKHKEN